MVLRVETNAIFTIYNRTERSKGQFGDIDLAGFVFKRNAACLKANFDSIPLNVPELTVRHHLLVYALAFLMCRKLTPIIWALSHQGPNE